MAWCLFHSWRALRVPNPLYGITETITLKNGTAIEVGVEGSDSKTVLIQKCRRCGKERPYQTDNFIPY